MKFSHFFIDRPIFASVVSIVIVIVGLVAYVGLPIAQFPDVAPPTIQVIASYPGASPEVIASTVAQPLEQEVNGVEDMLYMNSTSTADGRMTLTITFALGTDIDEAQVLVQNRVAIATARLPETVRRQGVQTQKSSPDLLLVVNILSPDDSFDQLYISNYVQLQLVDVLRRIEGVGSVNVFGGREYSMRVWLNPERMAALDLTAADVDAALREQNVQVAAGTIGAPPTSAPSAFQFPVRARGRLDTTDQFGEIVVKRTADGSIVRLREVSRVELGALDYSTISLLNGQPAVGLGISQRPGSNALATAQEVRRTMEELARDFPEGLNYRILFDPTVFVAESIRAVYHTILEAGALVVIVVLAFLQSWRATLIPLLAIPVSLIGTFGAMSALGFSLNSLSLFGLVLAIGIVVDDAIVVVENIERHLGDGLSPREASRRAMEEVGGAVVAIALVLGAVFVPTAFLSGISGQFYRQFAVTIAVSTALSALVSLTLSPALGALLLRPHHAPPDWFTGVLNLALGWFFRRFERIFGLLERFHARAVGRLIRRASLGLVAYAGLLGLTWLGFGQVPTGFIPAQDQGYVIIDGQLPEGASLSRTEAVAREVARLAGEHEGIEGTVAIVGFSGATRANAANSFAVFCPLKPFDERRGAELGAASISATLGEAFAPIKEARINVIPPPPVRGLGTSGGFKAEIQDRRGVGLERLLGAVEELAAAARGEQAIDEVFSSLRSETPQFLAEIDRTKAKMLGVSLDDVFSTLETFLGSSYVNDLNLFGRTYRVTTQADQQYRDSPDDVRLFEVRSDAGVMVPLGALVDIQRVAGPNRVERYDLYTSSPLQGTIARGFSSGQALDTMERLAARVLPSGVTLAWTDIAFQERLAGNTALLVFPLCVLFVFLVLAAQYESWSLPLAIILVVPLCLLSAIAGIWFRGMDNNILSQIGFVVLVGLACKNAILIVEFARQQQELAGMSRFDAVVEASRLRLRPILMTSLAFILGVLPLVIASGPGAESRQALGTAVFSGMLGVTAFGLYLTPIFYVVIRSFADRRARRRELARDAGAVDGTPSGASAH